MQNNLSYVNISNTHAKVTCPCGWQSESFRKGPFDPAEALAAYAIDHLKCNDAPPAVYYAVAQEIHGKLKVLGELELGLGMQAKMEEIAKGLAPKGKTMQVIEVKIVSSWEG